MNILTDLDLRTGLSMDRRTSLRPGAALKIYTLYIDDNRYSVPSLDMVSALEDRLAHEAARARLTASAHYLAVEVWEGDRLVSRVERD